MNEEILNNSEYVYSCPIKWGLKRYTCNVDYYSEEILPDLDYVICSAVNSSPEGVYDKQSLGVMLGFSIIDKQPEQYYDRAEVKLYEGLLEIVKSHHLITIDDNSIRITNLGRISLKNNVLYSFHHGSQMIYEHLNIKYVYPEALLMYPFYKDLGIYTELRHKSSYWPSDSEIPEILNHNTDELIKRIQLHSITDNHIYHAEIEPYFDFETKLVPVRLYIKSGEYLPVVFNGDNVASMATTLLNSEGNELQKENAILECLFKKLWDDKNAVLDYNALEPYFELVNYEELTKDYRTQWSDKRLFEQIVSMANSNCWLNISNNCDINVLYDYLDRFQDNLIWDILTSRVENEFLYENFKKYPWDLEILSQDNSKEISFIEQLIVLNGEYTDEWDWKVLGNRLEKSFVLSNLPLVNVDLAKYTEDTPEVRDCILANIDRRWDWNVIESSFDLGFILDEITNLKDYLGFSILFDRVFSDDIWSGRFLSEDSFINSAEANIKAGGPLSSMLFNQKNYLWNDSLIETFDKLGLISWPTSDYCPGFDQNPYLLWTKDFFSKYYSKLTSPVGRSYVSAHIKEESLITEFKDFEWDWTELSANTDISTSFIGKNQTLNWDWSILTERMFTSFKNLNAIGHPSFINKWNWAFLSQKLPIEFVNLNLIKFSNFWSWEDIIDRLVTAETRLNTEWLTKFASAINTIKDSLKRESVWSYLTAEYSYYELKQLLRITHSTGSFAWDLALFYEKPEFNIFTDLTECKEFIDWETLSRSTFVDNQLKYNPKAGYTQSSWNKDVKQLISDFCDYWDFAGLSTFESLNDKEWFLSSYAKELDWEYISRHSSIFRVEDKQALSNIINGYKRYISFQALSSRDDVDILQIKKIAPDADYDYNSLIANGVIEVTVDDVKASPSYSWDWGLLSRTKSFQPTTKFLMSFFDKSWDWNVLSKRVHGKVWTDPELIMRMADDSMVLNQVDWTSITSVQHFPAYPDILIKLPLDSVNWGCISQSRNIMLLLSDFADYLDWQAVSENKSFRVSDIDVLTEYADDLDWNIICSREDFTYSEQVLDQFSDRLDWSRVSASESIPFTAALVDKYVDRWNWPVLIKNKAFFNKVEIRDKGYLKQENIITFIDSFRETPQAFHFTHMSNAVKIIKMHSLQSRNRADGIFENSAGTNVHITAKAHDFARFYFVPQSPTQFYNEFLGKDRDSVKYYNRALELGLPKCPMPVFFIVDVEELLTKYPEKCYYSNGNMQKRSTKSFRIIDDPHKIQADEIYNKSNKEAKQQEFLFEDELDLSSLASLQICCYNDFQKDMLKSLVSNSPLCKRIVTRPDLYIRKNKELFFDDSDETLKIDTDHSNPFEFRIEYNTTTPGIINTGSILRQKGNSIYMSGSVQIKKDVPFKLFFEVSEPRKSSWLIYINN